MCVVSTQQLAAHGTRLKDVKEYAPYFKMLKAGCPIEAVQQKLIVDKLDPAIVSLGPDALYEAVEDRIAPPSLLLKDHKVYSKYFKMIQAGVPTEAVIQKMRVDGVSERALELGGEAAFSKLPERVQGIPASSRTDSKLQDDPVFAKYFKMLHAGLPEGAVRQKLQVDGLDARALDLGGGALVLDLYRMQDKSSYVKYRKMIQVGVAEGAVRQAMAHAGLDSRGL